MSESRRSGFNIVFKFATAVKTPTWQVYSSVLLSSAPTETWPQFLFFSSSSARTRSSGAPRVQ